MLMVQGLSPWPYGLQIYFVGILRSKLQELQVRQSGGLAVFIACRQNY